VYRIDIVSHISGCNFSRVKSVAQQIKQPGAESDVSRLANVTLLLQECLDTVARGNAQTSFGLWESAYHQANLAKTALNIASRTLCEVRSAELPDEIAEWLSMARRDLEALESNLKMLSTR
jgi:hypothetical protein